MAKLCFLGLAQCVCYLSLRSMADWHSSTLSLVVCFGLLCLFYLCSVARAWNQDSLFLVGMIILFFFCFRLLLVFDPRQELLSTDIYRYLWEGKVWRAGLSPYLYAPNDMALVSLKEQHLALWSRIDHRHLSSIYPPLAQVAFAVLPESVIGARLCFVGCELLTLSVLALWLRRLSYPSGRLLLYAWLPIVVVEISSSGHLEALLSLFLVGGLYLFSCSVSRGRKFLGCAILFAAILIKYVSVVPLLFVLCQWTRVDRTFSFKVWIVFFIAAALSLSCWGKEIVSSNGLRSYAEHWVFNGSGNALIEYLLNPWPMAKQVAKLVGIGVSLVMFYWCARSQFDLIMSVVLVFFVVLLFSPVVYPWYLLWFAPFLVILNSWRIALAPLVFCCTVLFSYEVLRHPQVWSPAPWALYLEYVPVYFLIVACWFSGRKLGRQLPHQ